MTQVIFCKFPEGDVIALFPDMPEGAGMINSYQHIGQHGAASVELLHELPEAGINEFMPLLKELIGIGYKLEVMNDGFITYHRKPTAYEIKFGEGATHYGEFLYSEAINPGTGEIRKWIKADGLRYYR